MRKCLLLFSGGLDSILAVKILKEQKIKIVLICFKSYFFDCDLAKESAKKLKLRLKVVDFSKEHLKFVKFPEYGFGSAINPCIDCHLLMLKQARKVMMPGKIDFIATGDVLGQRPFSQNKKTLLKMEKEAGLSGLVLRPLSAKLLPKTIPEKNRFVKREKLSAFQGKSRKPQISLAKKFKIKKIPSPAGGCILTDSEYAKKLKKLFKKVPDYAGRDARVLKKGRVFWSDDFLITVGRNRKENKELKNLKVKKDIILEPENFAGPTILIRGFDKKIKKETIKKGVEFLLNYTKKIPETIKISIIAA